MMLASCTDYTDYPEYSDVTYRESGIQLILRNDMRRTENEDYDLFFSNMIGNVMLTASKLDAEALEKVGVSPGASAGEYVDKIIEINGFDREMIYYDYDENRGSHSFRYTVGDDKGGVFYYVVVIGGGENLWYVEMVCSEDDSGLYAERFDEWRGGISVYAE